MDAILSAGIDFILYVQALGTPATDAFFEGFTKLGSTGYLLLVPLVLWCVDYRLGVRIGLAMACTLFVNTALKEWIGLDRPFTVDERIVSAGEGGYSLPSGHAQLVVAYWVLLAAWVNRRGFWVFAVVWIFLMGFSRVYLGVHYPTDVIVGWGIGALTTWPFVTRARALDTAWSAASPRLAFWIVGAATGAFLLDAVLVRDHGYIDPGIAGFALGSGLGAIWTGRRAEFDGAGAPWKRASRFALGVLVSLPLLGAMRRLGAPHGEWGTRLVVALDMAVLGLWMTGLAPWLFEKVRLASRAGGGEEPA